MSKNKSGQLPSSATWNGVDPKFQKWAGFSFGWHKNQSACAGPECKNKTHYSLHRRYKFTANLENKAFKEKYKNIPSVLKNMTSYKDDKWDKLWCCSESCFKKIMLAGMFSLDVPPEVAEKALFNDQDK